MASDRVSISDVRRATPLRPAAGGRAIPTSGSVPGPVPKGSSATPATEGATASRPPAGVAAANEAASDIATATLMTRPLVLVRNPDVLRPRDMVTTSIPSHRRGGTVVRSARGRSPQLLDQIAPLAPEQSPNPAARERGPRYVVAAPVGGRQW
ncbi:hypothetical protein GCM10010171_36340 [Actinokineospora fastidiosa]|uniref:Uncharacterized protein n=1 Tax=Actinokineospora fastidiosa TaxID=1816 RepID=A0A918GI49_9PSEU|nr:hypothetical protein GCM10010171_36340 [Actinokineospora fastidiosa]